MITTINGKNRILFHNGKLFLNEVQIAGEGIFPQKDVVFEFEVNNPEEKEVEICKDPSILEVNVHDSVSSKSVGPGQL